MDGLPEEAVIGADYFLIQGRQQATLDTGIAATHFTF